MAGATSYESNREWMEQPDFREPPLQLSGAADHWNRHIENGTGAHPGYGAGIRKALDALVGAGSPTTEHV